MKWSFQKLTNHLLNLKNNSRLPHNILLATTDENDGINLIKKLTNLKNLNSNRIFWLRYDPDFENQKDQITNLIFWSNLTKKNNEYVYFYIPELENYSPLFYNRLLKILEDHHSQIVGIFQTTNLHKILITLRSRCQEFILSSSTKTTLKDESFNQFVERFFTLISRNAEYYKFLNLLPSNLADLDFWNWFQKLLSNWQMQIKNQTIIDQKLFLILNYGWKLVLQNCFAHQEFNFQLDGKANWILFIDKISKNLLFNPKNDIQLKNT